MYVANNGDCLRCLRHAVPGEFCGRDDDEFWGNSKIPLEHIQGGRRNRQNLQEDVELVQLGYKSRFTTLAGTITPTLRKAIESIRLGAPCTGRDDDPLVPTIVAHEASSGLPRYDAKVNVLKAGTPMYADTGTHWYIMVPLNQWLQDAGVLKYPRLDLYPSCPLALKTAVRRELFLRAP